jgi:hypothetical protein
MPKFLNHLDLNGNQLKNTKLEITDSPLAEEGVIHYHDTNNTIRYHNGVGFITLGDNDVATTSAAGVVKLFSDTDVTESNVSAVSTTASRWYGVQLTENDKMVVNVPWTDSSALTEDQVEDFAAGMITSATHAGLTTTYDDNAGTLTFAVDGVLEDLDTLGAAGSDGQIIVATGAGVFQYESGSTLRSTINVDVAGTDNSTDVTLGTVTSNYLTLSGQEITAGTVPVVLGGTGATTAANARTNLGVDAAGTDNSTDVTLGTSSHDYLSISGQAITLAAIDLTTDVTGDLPISEGGTGQSTAAAAANALLNTDQGGALTIGINTDTITIAGNLTVEGTQTVIDSTTVATGDNMLELAKDNTSNATDFGWYGKFVDSGTKYAGMNWDASATKFVLGYGDDAPAGTIAWDTAGHLEVGKLTTTDLVIGGHTISDVDVTSEDSNADDHLMTAAAIVNLIADNENSFSTASGVEDNADVTDATNVAAAGAVMDGDFSGTSGLMKKDSAGVYSLDTSSYITSQRAISSTPTDGATTTAISSDWAFDNVKTAVPSSAVFTDTVDMGSGFTVSADTNTNATTITENDTLTIAGGTAINTVSNPDGTITINNEINNTNQLTNGANFITSSANITGTSAGITAGAVGAVKVVELTHDGSVVTNENSSNSTNSSVWTITHGMGSSRFYKVEVVLDSGDYDTVYVDVQRPSDATVKITFGADVANGAYRAMLTRMA